MKERSKYSIGSKEPGVSFVMTNTWSRRSSNSISIWLVLLSWQRESSGLVTFVYRRWPGKLDTKVLNLHWLNCFVTISVL